MTLLDAFTKFTGCHWESAVRRLNTTTVKHVLIYIDGKPVKIKPERKRPYKGKRVNTDEVVSYLRLIWTFSWFKYRKILSPVWQQMLYIVH